jgi:Tfp pilus assembly protein PilN
MTSILMWPLAVWGVVTAVLVILLIYRSTLTMQEDDQLFLGESESHMEKEQIEIMAKVNKITPLVKWVGAASGLLLLVIAGLAVYQGLQQMQ